MSATMIHGEAVTGKSFMTIDSEAAVFLAPDYRGGPTLYEAADAGYRDDASAWGVAWGDLRSVSTLIPIVGKVREWSPAERIFRRWYRKLVAALSKLAPIIGGMS
jgi:hypothetical protein